MNLRTIILVMALLGFLSSSIGGVLYYSSLQQSLSEDIDKEAEELTKSIAGNIDTYLVDQQQYVKVLAGLHEIKDALLRTNSDSLSQANSVLDHFNDTLSFSVCYLMDDKGNTIASSNRETSNSFVGKNYAFRPYFRHAIQGNPSIYMALGVTSGKRGVYYGHPVYGNNHNTPLGIVVIKVLENIEKELERTSHGFILLTDPHGVIFISSNKDWLYHVLWDVPPDKISEIAKSRQFGKGPWNWTGLKRIDDQHVFDNSGGEYHIHKKGIRKYSGWNIIYLHNHKEAFQELLAPAMKTAGYIILSVCILTGFFIILYKKANDTIIQRKKAEDRFRLAAEVASDLIYEWDVTDNILIWFGDVDGALGYEPGEFPRTIEAWVKLIHPDDIAQLADAVEQHRNSVVPIFYEYKIKRKDGSWRYWIDQGTPILDESGRPRTWIGVCTDITDRKQAEEKRLAHMNFLKNLELINRIISQSNDPEQMTREVLESMLDIFKCDRAWLLYPCDPSSPSWKVPIECSRPEFPGAFAEGIDIPNLPEIKDAIQTALDSNKPIVYDPVSGRSLPAEASKQFHIMSQINIAIHPKIGKSWLLGMHQCSHSRVWTEEDKQLFKEIGRRITDSLSSLLFLRDLRTNEEKYRALFEAAKDSIYMVKFTEEGPIIKDCNPQALKALGYSHEELVNKSPVDISPPVQPDGRSTSEFLLEVARAAMEGKPQLFNWTYCRADGTLTESEVTLNRVNIGSESYLQAIARDLTERKKAEEDLMEAYNIINRSPAVAFLWKNDEGWPVEYVSGNVRELLGYTPEDFTSGEVTYINVIHPDDLNRVSDEVTERNKDINIKDFTHESYRIITKQGNIKWVDERTQIRRDINGEITHYQGIVQDISERIQLESQLIHAEKLESVGTLAGGISHEFNNIMTSILGFTHVLSRRLSDDTTLSGYVDQIRKAAENAARLTKGLLQFSRDQQISMIPVDINELIHRMKLNTTEIIGEGIELKSVLTDSNLNVMADPHKIEKVIMSIISNARDAMQEGGVLTINTEPVNIDMEFISAKGYGDPGDYVLISISDTGTGIDDNNIEKIFEPFFTTKEVDKGTGLGLSIAYGIISQHNGYIDVLSEPGKGTTFHIYLPIKKHEQDS